MTRYDMALIIPVGLVVVVGLIREYREGWR